MTSPTYFDRIHEHFLKNIYTRPKGKIRLAVLQRDLAPFLNTSTRKNILDVGGGSGQMALCALSLGHHVTLVDISPKMLENAWQLATNANLASYLTLIQADACELDNLVKMGQFDMVFCHALLEWVEQGERLIEQCTHALKDEGILSLLHYNRQALLYAHHVFGNFDYLDDYLSNHLVNKHAAKLTPDWVREESLVHSWLEARQYKCQTRSGVRCFYDYMKPRDKDRNALQTIIEHELELSRDERFLPVARYIHSLWQRED